MAKAKPVNVAATAPAPAPAAADVQPPASAPTPPAFQATKPAALAADFARLAEVRGLPEVPAETQESALEPIDFAPGSIERFIASEDDRRVMRVVGYAGGFASQAIED